MTAAEHWALNAEVATRVMGLTLRVSPWDSSYQERELPQPPNTHVSGGRGDHWVYDTGAWVSRWGVVFAYSTEIDDAWAVVEKLIQHYHIRLLTPFGPGAPYFCGLTPLGGWNGRPDLEAAGETMPLAICRAALMVVE